MFHESNLRNADFPVITMNGASGHYGLLQQWVERIVEEITKYVDWPIISLKMDELAQTYIKRMDRIKCNPEYRLVVNEDSRIVQSVEISANGKCEIPLFLSRGGDIDKSTVDSIEQFGNEPGTAWIKIDGAPKSVKFMGDLLWDGDTRSFWNNQFITNNAPETTSAETQNINDIVDAEPTSTQNTATETIASPTNTETSAPSINEASANNDSAVTKVIASITYTEKKKEPTVNIVVPSNVHIPEESLPAHVKVTKTDKVNKEEASFFGDPKNIPVLIWKWGWNDPNGYWETWSWKKTNKKTN